MNELDPSTLSAARQGDRSAVAAIVRAWHRPIRAYVTALQLTSQDADDVAQEVFLRALQRLDRVESLKALGPFLKGVAKNVVRERQRKFARENRAYLRLVDERSAQATETAGATWFSDPEILAALRSCLSNLPEQAQTMLALRYSNDRTSQQIGEQVGMKADAVRTAMRRARTALLQCIQSTYSTAEDVM